MTELVLTWWERIVHFFGRNTQCTATWGDPEVCTLYCLRNRFHFGPHRDCCDGWEGESSQRDGKQVSE